MWLTGKATDTYLYYGIVYPDCGIGKELCRSGSYKGLFTIDDI